MTYIPPIFEYHVINKYYTIKKLSGFEKCGTTSLLYSLNKHPETYMGYDDEENLKETHLLRNGLVKEFRDMYRGHRDVKPELGKPTINGFKSPEILMSQSYIHNMEKYFPYTDFIISTRHPILHFQSLYNYKFRPDKYSGERRPDPIALIGSCGHQCVKHCVPKNASQYGDLKENRGSLKSVCTNKALFHYGLSRIMLTPMNTTEELVLLDHNDWSKHSNFKGRIFLTEIGQLGDKNETRKAEFTRGLEDFLGLTPNSFDWKTIINAGTVKYIDICDLEHKPVRDRLLEIGTNASKWILTYFMKSPRVVVANRDHMIELITAWQTDPCTS